MKIHLLFGCNGLTDAAGFTMCKGVVNPIVGLSAFPRSEVQKVEKFMDSACGLYDAPCYDYNKCINIINFLYRQFGMIDEVTLHKIQGFIKMHKTCGIYIMLLPQEDFDERYKNTG